VKSGLFTKDLRIDYGTFCAVRDVSLKVPSGALYGLVGPNGAGKTSTLNALAGLLEPTHGDVVFDGIDLAIEPSKVRKQVAYMPDLAPVIPDLKVFEFLEYFARMYGLRGDKIKEAVDASLAAVRMEDSRDKFGKALSRGMTQRVVLAKCLLFKPRFLLLDEPASGLDPLSRADLWKTLKALSVEGVTIVLSSHILSELYENCSHLGIMLEGTLRDQGPISEVLRRHSKPKARLRLRSVGDQEKLLAVISRYPTISSPLSDEKGIAFLFEGDEAAQAELIKALIAAAPGIYDVHSERSNLESVLRFFEEKENAPESKE
jgi:ABC-2 type transport system ATP-binding protein